MTIFVADVAGKPNVTAALRNAVRRLKTIRHPHIVKYLSSAETDTEILIATERVYPLVNQLQEVKQSSEAILWLLNLLLVYMHNRLSWTNVG